MLLETPRDINHCNGTVRRLTQLLVELTIDSYGLTGSAPPLQFSVVRREHLDQHTERKPSSSRSSRLTLPRFFSGAPSVTAGATPA